MQRYPAKLIARIIGPVARLNRGRPGLTPCLTALPQQLIQNGIPMNTKTATRDWGATLFLPKTQFPMKAGLPQLEPKLLERWAKLGLYHRLREAAKGRPKFILHDGPPYANGNIHMGTALNKILKDMVTR